jgi:hypothetical protein
MSKLETITIDTPSGSNTMQIGSTNTATINLGVSGDTINVPAGVTIANAGTATGFGGTMTPAFEAKLGTNQSVNASAQTKVAIDTEVYDTDGCFDTSNYRFTPTTAGKYLVYGAINMTPSSNNALNEGMASFQFNGTRTRTAYFNSNTSHYAVAYNPFLIEVLTFNGSSDYVELWGRASGTNAVQRFTKEHESGTYFGAFRILI